MIAWISYTVLVNTMDVDLCPNKGPDGNSDGTLKLLELVLSKIEDFINSTFQIILYIFVFKMVNVYNKARCETLEELRKWNRRVDLL